MQKITIIKIKSIYFIFIFNIIRSNIDIIGPVNQADGIGQISIGIFETIKDQIKTFVFPNDYPFSAPMCELLTTGGGTVRFGPNLYANGKICLSILGTWEGPGWAPNLSLSAVLISIQSLMSENAAQNEPGHEKAKKIEIDGV